MRATFTQRFNQEQKMEQEISKVWGYAVSPSHLECSKASKVQQKAVIINRAIKPLIMDKRKPMMSTQHQLLIKQIAQIEHQKKMRKKAEEKNESQFNVSKLMNDRVREYNYLIDHKHIKEKNSEDTKRVLKLKPKSEAEQIVDQIKQKNKQLILTEDINKQLKINKSIAILYRKYKQKMYEEHGENEEKRLHSTLVANASNKHTNPRIRTKSMASQGRVRNYSECLSKLKVKGQSQENQMEVENAEESINIQQQFMNEEEIKKNNEFQRKIQNNKQFLDMYKFKIKTLKNFNKLKDKSARKSFSNKAKMPKQQEYRLRIENSLFSGIERDTRTPHLDEHLISELRQKRKDQIKYFSSFLEKRNRKFKKPWGNKILIKFDSNSQAKQMLEGTSSSISPNKTQYFTATNNSQLQHQTNKSSSFYSMPKNMGEEDRQIFESMREDQQDPRLYETMCKNEKVNLFLKAAKRNKF